MMELVADLAGLLASRGVIPASEALRVRRMAASSGRVQIRVLRELDLVSDSQVSRALASELSIDVLGLDELSGVDVDALRCLSQDLAQAHLVLPVRLESRQGKRVLLLAMADPLCAHSVHTVERATGRTVDPLLADAGALVRAIGLGYGQVSTRLIPRPDPTAKDGFGVLVGGRLIGEPETQPAHRLEDEASPSQMVQALVNVLVDRGLIDDDEFAVALRRILREDLEG